MQTADYIFRDRSATSINCTVTCRSPVARPPFLRLRRLLIYLTGLKSTKEKDFLDTSVHLYRRRRMEMAKKEDSRDTWHQSSLPAWYIGTRSAWRGRSCQSWWCQSWVRPSLRGRPSPRRGWSSWSRSRHRTGGGLPLSDLERDEIQSR